MIYFDSDVLINYLVIQNPDAHTTATKLYEKATAEGRFFVSLLSLQEISFVLAKLKVPSDVISKKTGVFLTEELANYDLGLFRRACFFAEQIGYQNMNDCLHLAIAEKHCTELCTFNKSDFKQLQNYTSLKITIL